jgi:hypothetical protein
LPIERPYLERRLLMSDEKRRFTRVPFRVEAEIAIGDASHRADEIKNLSVGGCLLSMPGEFEAGAPCHVRIQLSGTSSELRVEVDGDVVRSGSGEVAVKFTGVEIDSLFHLQNIVRYNSSDPDAVEAELRANLGIV